MKSPQKRSSKPVPKKVLIVDDHPMTRQGLITLIGGEADLAVCAEAETAPRAIELAQAQQPDLILADISLPGKNGLELVKDLRTLLPKIPVLVISMHEEMLYAERVLRAGGRGYIMKQEGGKKIMEGIRQVLAGRIYLSEKMSAQMLENLSGQNLRASRPPIEQLTDREFEVFQLIGQGLSTNQIAQHLHLSAKTVEVHRVHIKEKLKLQTANELIRYAVRWVEADKPDI